MSHKLLHLTTGYKPSNQAYKICFNAIAIRYIQEHSEQGKAVWGETLIIYGSDHGEDSSAVVVHEPYDQVLRLWGDALSE